jgi:phosphoenolpyruvate-protein kinase (PTS system EI component)
MVAEAAKRHHIDLSVCGEMAGNPRLAAFFFGIGITNLSMSPPLIPRLKRRISDLNMAACSDLAMKALSCASATEVSALFSE